jgi:hypothetical protein
LVDFSLGPVLGLLRKQQPTLFAGEAGLAQFFILLAVWEIAYQLPLHHPLQPLEV